MDGEKWRSCGDGRVDDFDGRLHCQIGRGNSLDQMSDHTRYVNEYVICVSV